MLFSSWSSLLRILGVGIPAYFALLLLLRISGKRTLSKMNAFDLVITVAFGSALSAALLSRDVALLDVILGFSVLVLLQFVITWLSVRFPRIDRLVKSEPRLLYHNGTFIEQAMKNERVTEREMHAAIRAQGFSELENVAAVVLETDGTFSIIRRQEKQPDTLKHVSGP